MQRFPCLSPAPGLRARRAATPPARNPATGALIGHATRVGILRHAQQAMRDNADRIAAALPLEEGKTSADAQGKVISGADAIDWAADAGQVGISPSRFNIRHGLYDRFAKTFAQAIAQVRTAGGMDPSAQMGPFGIETATRLTQDVIDHGAALMTGAPRRGSRHPGKRARKRRGHRRPASASSGRRNDATSA